MNLGVVPVLYVIVIELTERKRNRKPITPEDLPPPPMPTASLG
jgi:hypothetical protein